MRVDPLSGAVGSERTYLSTRPHWFRALRQGFPGVVLLVAGLMLMLFGGQIDQLLSNWASNLLTPPGSDSRARPVSGLISGFELGLPAAFTWAAAILTLLGSVVLGWAFLQRHFAEYAITVSSKTGGRIVKVQGILSRHTVAVPLLMVNDLVLYEPMLGRILGWGHLDIEMGNDYQGDRLEYIPNPRVFYAALTTLLDHGSAGLPHRPGGTLPQDAHRYPLP